ERVMKMHSQAKTRAPSTPARGAQMTAIPPIVGEALRSSGKPLDTATRAYMEPRFGHDFSQVRIHSNGLAAESARAVNAAAYTVGQDLVFGAGKYRPGTPVGQRLIAHELAHTVQQNGGASDSGPLTMTAPQDGSEVEAKRAASAVMQGQ